MKRSLPVLSIVLSLPLTLACRKPPPPAPAALPAALGAKTAEASKSKPMPAQLPAVVAKVNGEAVERWELDNAVHALEGRAGSQIPPDKRDEVLRGLLDQLVSFHVLVQESRARKLDVSDAELEARLTEIKKGFASEQAFQQELSSQGLTLEQLRFQARSSMQVAKLVDAEIKPKISVQDAEVDAFYKENLERFKQGETVHASHIMIGLPPNADAPTKQQARAKAQQVLEVPAAARLRKAGGREIERCGQRRQRRRPQIPPQRPDGSGVPKPLPSPSNRVASAASTKPPSASPTSSRSSNAGRPAPRPSRRSAARSKSS